MVYRRKNVALCVQRFHVFRATLKATTGNPRNMSSRNDGKMRGLIVYPSSLGYRVLLDFPSKRVRRMQEVCVCVLDTYGTERKAGW